MPILCEIRFLYKTFLCKNVTTFQCVLKSISIYRNEVFWKVFYGLILLNKGILYWLYLWYIVNPWTEIVKVRQLYWTLSWTTQWNVDSVSWVITHSVWLLLFAFLSYKTGIASISLSLLYKMHEKLKEICLEPYWKIGNWSNSEENVRTVTLQLHCIYYLPRIFRRFWVCFLKGIFLKEEK